MFFSARHSSYRPLAGAPQNMEGLRGLPFSSTQSKEPLVVGFFLKDLVVFMKELAAWS
jgi:hypothetical protein